MHCTVLLRNVHYLLIHCNLLYFVVGLGKTLQCVAFIAGLFSSKKARTALVVAPVSVLPVWESEFHKWAPFIHVAVFHGKRNSRAISELQRRGGVLLTSYGTCSSDPGALGAVSVASPGVSTSFVEWEPAPIPDEYGDGCGLWDISVLDEGHKIKNPATLVHKAMQAIPSAYRLLLTGTPIQNNLDELWSLVDYFSWGGLLGTRRSFNKEIAGRIVAGRDKLATSDDQQDGERAARLLMDMLRPHMLRREKTLLSRITDLGAKKEVVIWCPMVPVQVGDVVFSRSQILILCIPLISGQCI